MKCWFCKQEIKDGDTHVVERPMTPQDRLNYPTAAAIVVCRVSMHVETPALIGRLEGIVK